MSEQVISVADLKKILEAKVDIQLIDVRTIDKHEAFNIGGKNIPLTELPLRLNELDKNKMLVTYCTRGNSSMRALNFLVSEGFSNVKSLTGGVTAWQEQT